MKLAVFGPKYVRGSVYQDLEFVCECIESVGDDVDHIISGGGGGVEQLALAYAKEAQIPYDVIWPRLHPETTPEVAFAVRNKKIVKAADTVLLISHGEIGPIPMGVVKLASSMAKELIMLPLV